MDEDAVNEKHPSLTVIIKSVRIRLRIILIHNIKKKTVNEQVYDASQPYVKWQTVSLPNQLFKLLDFRN